MKMMSSSANPRKFSEKIAIQQRKLNEEQSAFQQIMHEVHTITRFPTPVAAQAMGAPNVCWNQRVVGSLPNVFEIAYPNQRPDYQEYGNTALYVGQWPGGVASVSGVAPPLFVAGPPPGANFSTAGPLHHHHLHRAGSSGAAHRGRSPGAAHYHPYRTPSPQHSPLPSSSPSGVGLRTRSPDHQRLTPPSASLGPMTSSPSMSASAYLVPPQDSGWRRTHSDPGIHASVTHPGIVDAISGDQQAFLTGFSNHSPQNGSPNGDAPLSAGYLDPKASYGMSTFRPPNMQTLSISPGDLSAGSSQGSISSNTGSLPDLSQLPNSPGQSVPAQCAMHAHNYQQQQLHYSQSLGFGSQMGQQAGQTGIQGASVAHQQRHSIQLPVQYAQAHFGAIGAICSYGGSQSSSPGGGNPESPHSGPNSPATTANSESPGASQQGQSSPGSPYYSLPAQLQNINIDSCDALKNQQQQQQNFFNASVQQQQQFKVPTSPVLATQFGQYPVQHNISSSFQSASSVPMGQNAQMLNSPVPQSQQQQCEVFSPPLYTQQPLPSPNSGKIPNIILTGPCENMNALPIASGYMDPAVAMLSSDLRLTLDPSDLESLQILSNEQDMIDADSEDALRLDRI